MIRTPFIQTRLYPITRPIFISRRRGFRTASTAVRALLMLAALCVLLFSCSAFSATLDLRSVSVPDLSRVVLKEMLKADYVLAPEVVNSDAKLSLSVSNQSHESIINTLSQTLALSGFSMVEREGVYYISKISAQPQSSPQDLVPPPGQLPAEQKGRGAEDRFYTYKAKARPLPYLTKLAKFVGASVAEGDMVGDVLVFSASERVRKRLEAVLAVVDVPAQAVTIRAALIEFSDSSDKGNSLALSVLAKNLKATFKAGAALANSVTFSNATLQAALSAIDSDNRFTYLSRPMLRVLDGETAKIAVGSDVPTRGAVTQDKNGNSFQSINYNSSGVILEVTPRIVGELVTLKVDQQISSFGATTTSNIDSPSLFKRQASTTIDVKRGQLIALAGLDEDKDNQSRAGLSFMPDWTYSNSTQKTRSQILLLLEVSDDKQQTL